MSYYGDIALEATIDVQFTTVDSTGAPTTLAGTPVISAYIGNSTTQLTAGITLSVDFDGVTGLHNVRVAATAANGYTAATDVSLVITTGTVDAVSVVGYVVGSFSIANRPVNVTRFGGTAGTFNAGRPEVNATHVGGSGIDQSAGVLGVNVKQISGDTTAADNLEAALDDTAGPVPSQGIVDQGTAQSATGTTVVLRSAAAFADDTLIGAVIQVLGSTQGYWQTRIITDNTLADDTVTVPTWTVTPSGTITYRIYGSAPGASLADITAAMFDTDSGETYASAVAGSVVKEIADNATGGGLDAAGVRAAVGLASADLDTQLGDLPTNAELATSQAAADDATLAAIAALNNLTADNIWDEAIGDGTITARQAMRVLIAALAGKVSGAATTTMTFRNDADDADVIVATVDADGNRSAVTVTP